MQRTAVIVGAAAFAPLAVLVAMLQAGNLREENSRVVEEKFATARELNARMDGMLMADQSALRVLAGSAAFTDQDWPRARERTKGVVADNRRWRDVILTDAASRRQLWSLREGAREASPDSVVTAFLDGDKARLIGDIGGAPPGCPCVVIHQPIYRGGGLQYVLSVELAAQPFQDLLMSNVEAPNVAAIVDRDGRFIARTTGFRERLGKPATKYVRNAIAADRRGIYQGVTYEGLVNRTAYETSSLSGYSTHIAIPAQQLNILGAGSTGLGVLAVALAALAAVAGMSFAVREQLRWRADEARRARAQKMEAIGQFASGVAHDFNNFLTVILGNLRRLQAGELAPDQATALDRAVSAAERGSNLVSQLMSFARDRDLVLESVDLLATVREAEPLLADAVGPKVAIRVTGVGEQPPVSTNRVELERALINLATNARDAMPDGGVLSLTVQPATARGRVELLVRDTGKGMEEAEAARVFDPFFTTKAAGGGTGLGLAQVQSLVALSGGEVSLTSAPGAGATFRLQFPVWTGQSGDG